MRCTLITSAIVTLIAATITTAASVEQRAAACAPEPKGWGPKPSSDTVSAFLALPAFSNGANAATTPIGYVKQFSNLQAANTLPSGLLCVELTRSYDVGFCAARCNAIKGCESFNIYYQRDPCVNPGTGASSCANPSSTTNIKCAFWSGIVTAENAVNKGQYRNKFQIAIVGSNGYTNANVLIKQARGEIKQPGNSAQPYCSSILGYTTPIITATVVATSTARRITKSTGINTALTGTTVIDVVTVTSTEVVLTATTLTQPTTTVETKTSLTTTTALVPTTELTSETTIFTTMTDSFPTTTTTTVISSVPAVQSPVKRDISLPLILSRYPANIVTAACSLAITRITKTCTVTQIRISTVNTIVSTQAVSVTTTRTITGVTSSTANFIDRVTSISTAITNPTITSTSTTVITETAFQATTTTLTKVISQATVTSTTPVITATLITTTTAAAAPACTPIANIFQVVGGDLTGQFLKKRDNSVLSPVIPVPDITNARKYHFRSDGRVFGESDDYCWASHQVLVESLVQIEGFTLAEPLFCTAQSNSLVSAPPNAGGALSCRGRYANQDNVKANFVSCNGEIHVYWQTYYEDIDLASRGCTPITLAVLPVGENC